MGTPLFQAHLAAIQDEHRAQKKRGKLRLLAQWAPQRVAEVRHSDQSQMRKEGFPVTWFSTWVDT